MPEGPTIRNTADRLREVLAGRRIEHAQSPLKKAAAEDWTGKLTGRLVLDVRSHGKNLFVDFDGGWTLYTHMMMWGTWHVYTRDEPWRKEASKARVVLATADHIARSRASGDQDIWVPFLDEYPHMDHSTMPGRAEDPD